MARSGDFPTDDEVADAIKRRGRLSLRALCEVFWPKLRWRPLFDGEDSVAEGAGPDGRSPAMRVWDALGRLLIRDRVRVAGHDPDEVDCLAAASFELPGQRLSRPPR